MDDEKTETAPGSQEKPGKQDTILYRFYRKPMARKLTILARSAMPNRMKIATFSSEIMRRLKCTSLGVGRKENEATIIEMMDNLAGMGYSQKWIEEVFYSTMKGYVSILSKAQKF